MKKLPLVLQISIFIFLPFFVLMSRFSPAYSGTEDDLENQIDDTQQQIEEHESTLAEIEALIDDLANSNYSVTQQINILNEEISKLQEEIDTKNEEINTKLEEIAAKESILNEKKDLLASVSGQLYIESRIGSVEFFFSSVNIDEFLQSLFVKKNAISVLKDEITEITGEFEDLAILKQELEDEKVELDTQKEDLDDSYDLLAAERAKLQAQLNEKYNSRDLISRTINGLKADLTDLQYQLLIVRQGGTNVDPNTVPSTGEYITTLAGFKASAPSGSFGVFSIGALTHRNGMSQWGARARANDGQSYTQIMNFYYPGKNLRTGTVVVDGKTENIMTNIKTSAYGTLNFEEDYLLRLGEMPEYYPKEALKAQAIAARTYAVRYTKNGDNTICVDENCQVVGTTKKTGAWKTAVEETRGVILTNSDGTAALTQYASLHGGWVNGVGWDTTTGSGDYSGWMAYAWDSIANHPWFYKIWYRYDSVNKYSDSADSCSRKPWLSMSEMSDIVNAYQVWIQHNRSDSRIIPIYDACHSSGNPYSFAEMRSIANKPVTSISAVVTSSSGGTTTSVTFYTNAGTISMSGNDFKTVYNMRAPGHLMILQSGFVHINIEKK
ncbi:MAG: SpoIID/LytB domain-containing protein [Candidatus Dojkabacteria bacterium]|nr:SpoIID/LytB domain-containing protein [Candidatus Dojkabacteria bacterium]